MISSDRLQDLAETAGRNSGWDGRVYAVWYHTPHFACLWNKYGHDITLKLCDWMQTAPEDLVLEVFEKVLASIQKKEPPKASDGLKRWTDDNRPRWERR